MIDLARYNQLKSQVEQLQSEADRAAGALEQLMGRLEAEFGCKTLKAAERLLAKLEGETEAAEVAYNKALKEFEKKWGSYLET